MKKLFLMTAIAGASFFFAACGNNSADANKITGDSSANVVKPSDNSSATNPSVADTAYSNNNADTLKKDSSKMKK